MSNEPGTLYVVATPIGNLQDLGLRAIEVLRGVELILAEDTRHSRRLLEHHGIRTALQPFHDHNEKRAASKVIERLARGACIALICDAGTPLISDPGYSLVVLAHARHLRVVPIPGPSAVTCALSVAGLATDRFAFEGFLPAARGARQRRLQSLAAEERTLVFLEAPHRVTALLDELSSVFGGARRATLARELTKVFETVRAGSLAELSAWLAADADRRRGEFVVLVAGSPREPERGLDADARRTLAVLLEEMPLKRAVEIARRLTGARKNDLYREAVHLSGEERGA